jgi:hypothetical protein
LEEGGYMKDKINELATNSKNENVSLEVFTAVIMKNDVF